MSLDRRRFEQVVTDAVLVSIDLVLVNDKNQVLLGYRTNAPAKGFWFVPGSSVRKPETLHQAIRRVAKRELGLEDLPGPVKLLGVYDHIYEDSFFDPAVPTHYVVMACRCDVSADLTVTPDDQHDDLRFFDIAEALQSPDVHEYTKNYFRPNPSNLFLPGPAILP